jgi:hypothetical protein
MVVSVSLETSPGDDVKVMPSAGEGIEMEN